MEQIEKNGRLDEWCQDNVDWLRKTYGTDNVVSAVLHMDEETPIFMLPSSPLSWESVRSRRRSRPSRRDTGRKPLPLVCVPMKS